MLGHHTGRWADHQQSEFADDLVLFNPKVTQQGWKNHVRVVASDTIQGAAIVGFATKKLGAKTFAILHDNQAMGQGVGQVAREKSSSKAAP